MNKLVPTLIACNVLISFAVGYLYWEMDKKTTNVIQAPSQSFVVVDFSALSQRLMVSMSDRISAQDLELNPAMIELMAQSEAAKLVRTVKTHKPDAIVLNKQSIVHTPDAIDITNEIASKMGLPEVTKEDLEAFITGVPPKEREKPVGVR